MADGFITSGTQVIGEQSRQIEGRVRAQRGQAMLLAGVGRRRVGLVGQVADVGGVQDTADGLGGDLVPPGTPKPSKPPDDKDAAERMPTRPQPVAPHLELHRGPSHPGRTGHSRGQQPARCLHRANNRAVTVVARHWT
jgi:hypothetical protein